MRNCRSLLVFPIFSALFFFNACTKIKGTDIGADLLPAIDNVLTFDTTLEVSASTFLLPDSSLPKIGRNVNGNIGQFVVGHISNDLQFGKTTASMFFELKPDFFPYYFENKPDSLYLDSVVLCLKWTTTFGDTNGVQTIRVNRVSELLRADTAYSTNKDVAYSELLGSKTFAPSILDDSLYLFRQSTSKQLRIRLDDNFGIKLLRLDTTNFAPYKNDSTFRDYLRGFALTPEVNASANALMGFSLSDTLSYLRLYYKYDKNGRRDTTTRDFSFNTQTYGVGINRIKRSYENAEIQSHLGSKPGGDSLVYVQSTPGTYTILKFPGLDQFKQSKGNVIVHLAQLSMQEVVTPGRRSLLFGTPDYIYAEAFDSTNRKYFPFLSDGFTNGQFDASLYGGQRKYTANANNQLISSYRINLTRYMQGIITRNSLNYPLRLMAPYSVKYDDLYINFALNNLCMGNVVLGGGNHSEQKMKLRLVYSKL